MKGLDRELQRQRIAKVLPHIAPGSNVLDVGCADGAVFRAAEGRIARGVGIDLQQPDSWIGDPFELRVGEFPDVVKAGEVFDAITMLAVVEHAPRDELEKWAKAIPDMLVPGGPLLITTPSPRVDDILHVLMKLRILDGMEAHEHYGFDPRTVPDIFGTGHLRLVRHQRFQLGLNHLFVFHNE
jgi:2-polyprenyl-3-methyl-5-hydroxy-6-metoxy-1,4-benzoquinol methylase